MERLKLNKILKEQAVELNACYKGISNMDRVLTEGELIDLWKNYIDFGIKKNFPSNTFIVEQFDEELLHEKGVYVDETITLNDRSGVMVVNGKCTGVIMQSGFSVATIYLRHDADVEILVKGMSKVFVHCYDNAICHIRQSEMGRCYVYMHDNSTETHEGDINIRSNR